MTDQNDDVKEATQRDFVLGFHTIFESCDIVQARDVALKIILAEDYHLVCLIHLF